MKPVLKILSLVLALVLFSAHAYLVGVNPIFYLQPVQIAAVIGLTYFFAAFHLGWRKAAMGFATAFGCSHVTDFTEQDASFFASNARFWSLAASTLLVFTGIVLLLQNVHDAEKAGQAAAITFGNWVYGLILAALLSSRKG